MFHVSYAHMIGKYHTSDVAQLCAGRQHQVSAVATATPTLVQQSNTHIGSKHQRLDTVVVRLAQLYVDCGRPHNMLALA